MSSALLYATLFTWCVIGERRLMYWLTTASLNGGRLLETSRSFHYWRPAPRGRPLPWLESLGNVAINLARGRGDKHPSHCINSGNKKRRKRESLKSCKTTLTVNVTVMEAANTSRSRNTRNPTACTYQDTDDNYGNAFSLCSLG